MTLLSHFVKGHSNNLDRRSKLIKDLKDSQQNLLLVLLHMVDTVIPDSKLSRDFRVKYPDDVSMDQLYGKCLAINIICSIKIIIKHSNNIICLHRDFAIFYCLAVLTVSAV